MLDSGYARHNCTLTSPVTVDANASANPAVDADIPGDRIATKPVTPTTALDNRLNRADSQRLTAKRHKTAYDVAMWRSLTAPHPIIRVGILETNSQLERGGLNREADRIHATEHVPQEF